jgi:hypothetical protein
MKYLSNSLHGLTKNPIIKKNNDNDNDNERINHQLLQLTEQIPREDPQSFYRDFGLLTHPRSGKPVEYLTCYQREFWKDIDRYHYALAIKSNKIGLSTLTLLNLFYHMITDCAGYQALVIAQSLRMSREHLYTLRKLIMDSEKYRGFLITMRDIVDDKDVLLREEKTKVTEMFIRNPYNRFKPSRIIAIPANAGQSVSWKEVKYVYCSDITMTDKNYDATINGAFTRLANTEGYFVIETIPNGPRGLVYDLWLQNRTATTKAEPDRSFFKVREYPVLFGVQAGLITEEFLEGEKSRLGLEYPKYYECSFLATGGNVFNLAEIDQCISAANYDPEDPQILHNLTNPKSMGVDPGYGTSKGAYVIVQLRNGVIEILKAEEINRASHSYFVNTVYSEMLRYSIENIYADASNPGFINDIKSRIGEITYDIMKDVKENQSNMERIVPVTFNPLNRQMLTNTVRFVSDGFLRTHPSFQSLIAQMRAAQHSEGKLIKNKMEGRSFDLIDSMFLALLHYNFSLELQK